ncbi:hypothetical protein C900_03462 [Fulvivirga imtechensis AK7]|uniref:Uncharacterized protein n=1 Tax=Fulvivirga imtechensis AK7 TaxID=1237149 RepID=L8JT75_9BACT|nr:hypothetical protein C900_03462 [Fulvivirga imtechensis AK7]
MLCFFEKGQVILKIPFMGGFLNDAYPETLFCPATVHKIL